MVPNWCENVAIIGGEVSDLQELRKHCGNSPVTLFSFIQPEPVYLEGRWDNFEPKGIEAGENPSYENGTWSHWRRLNWGTKWEPIITFSALDEGKLVISMNTQWSPPIGVFKTLLAQGFEVEAYYIEPLLGYAGIFENGRVEEFEIDSLQKAEEILPAKLKSFFPPKYFFDCEDNEAQTTETALDQ